MRGLKPTSIPTVVSELIVASFTDAWIETLQASKGVVTSYVASFTDAWIETNLDIIWGTYDKVASFTDAWIETATITFATTAGGSRIFYRCVD